MNFHLSNVSLYYDMEKEGGTVALQDVTLFLDGKGLVGVRGPSGSGKSSLLYTMAGLRKPTEGKIFYGKTDLSSLRAFQLAQLRRREFGFIFQQHFLINYLTALENVLVPLNSSNRAVKAKAMKLLERLGVAQCAHKYPYQLSGGQCQRIAIARALMTNPKVIFGDEPTAALDHKSACEVMELIAEYSKDALVILVTHDESLIKKADKVITINDGKITGITSGRDVR